MQIVLEDLTSRELAYRGRLEPEVEESLVTVGRFQVAIDVVAMLDKESRLLARIAGNGRIAVLARLRDQTVSFRHVSAGSPGVRSGPADR